jgi:ABC-type oligopeptide transport system substrate-binding subunit
VRALDDVTLAVELEGPTSYLPHLLVHCASLPVPRHVVEVHGQAWAEAENLVTNGPFTLETWRRGRSLVLSRNHKYHADSTGNVQQVELFLVDEWSARLHSYEADDLDILHLWGLPPAERDSAQQRHAGEYISVPSLQTYYVGFDVSQPPFDDPRVRQAFALATDRHMLAHVAMRGHEFPATGGFVPVGMPGHAAGIGLPYDTDRARRLLAEAGYPGGRGFPAVAALGARDRQPLSSSLQAQWRENLGVEIRWELLEYGAYYDRLDIDPPPIFLSGWLADYPDPDDFLRASPHRYHTRLQDEIYTGLVRQARRVTDQAIRMELYRQADEILVEQAVIIPLTYGRLHLLVKPWVRKLPMSPVKAWFWNDIILDPH